MKVSQFTTIHYVSLSPSSTVRDVIASFLERRVDIGCVVNGRKLAGIVHKHAIYRAILSGVELNSPVRTLMNESVITIQKDQDLLEARDVMIKGNVSQAVVLDENGDVFGIMSKSDLVTSHMSALEDMYSRMRTLVENLQDAVISVDSTLNITTYNQIALDLLNLHGKQLSNVPIDDVLPDFRKWLTDTIQTGKVHEAKRIRFRHRTVIASFLPIREMEKVTGAMAVLRDVTSYESIAMELESTTRLKRTLDSALELAYDGVAVTSQDGKITMVNKGFLELYELEEKDVIGKPISLAAPEIPSFLSLKHGHKVDGEIIKINGHHCLVAQMPIHRDGEQLGAIYKIIFRQLDAWKNTLSRLEKLENELNYYRGELIRMSNESMPFSHVISESPQMDKFKQEAAIAAKSMSNILLTGESGTGKELFAEGIHNLSGRKGKFVKVNCGAIPEALLESEFFGYADGAFTGAKKGGKPGKFELAHEGTLFLDEIGDMPLSLQVKLLRVLQEQEFERVGATKTTKVDVRIVTATNRSLENLVKDGLFREDLYYRIHVIHLHIPPLRERTEDIPVLCRHLIKKLSAKAKRAIEGVTPAAMRIFQNYHWPGNIRQLENVLERAIHYTDNGWVDTPHVPREIMDEPPVSMQGKPAAQVSQSGRTLSLSEAEKQMILDALNQFNGNRTHAAKALGFSRTTLYQKMKKFKIKEELAFKTPVY